MPESLQPYPPGNFDSFWQSVVEEAAEEPLDFRRTPERDHAAANGHSLERIDFRGFGGHAMHGWIAFPAEARALPSFLWVPPYGRESLLPNEYGTREGMCSMSFNLHGLEAFHQEDYKPERGYFTDGLESPHRYVFRRMAQHCLIALRVLQAQTEVDENRIAASGMSQGGGIAIWLGALSDMVKCVAADMPFVGALPWVFEREVHRYPLKEITDWWAGDPERQASAMRTMAYFDTLNMATRCHKPTLVSLGLRDPAVVPEQVEAIYRALPSPKLLRKIEGGHDWHPSMIAANRDWMLEQMPAIP